MTEPHLTDQKSVTPPRRKPDPALRNDDGADLFAQTKHKRTLGLWLVDTLIYPLVNNFGVFGISVFATYLTQHGWPQPANGRALAGWKQRIGDVFKSRGKWVDTQLENKLGWSNKAASMARMVFFSFFDGTFIAPFVKILEDRRERMALAIDNALGTKPKDESVYEAEPKQSWRSVIEGRLLTSLIVAPTALLLSRKNVAGESLNDFLFNHPGEKRGEQIEKTMPRLKGWIEKLFGKVHLPFFAKTVYFEAFYTSVCTAGLYLISRAVATKHPKKERPHVHHTTTPRTSADEAPEQTATTQQPEVPPTANLSHVERQNRVTPPAPAAELTA